MKSALIIDRRDPALALLTRPERWVLAGPSWGTPTARSPRHEAWMGSRQQVHPHLEMMLVLRGRGVCGIGGRLYRYSPGTALVFPPYLKRDKGHPPWVGPFARLWVSFPREVMANYYIYCKGISHARVRRCRCFTLAEIGISPALIRSFSAATTDLSEAHRRLQLTALLCAVAAGLMEKPGTPENATEAGQRQKIEAVRRHIEQEGPFFRLTELGRLFDISPFHLSRLFKRQTGFTVHQFVDRCRLLKMSAMKDRGSADKAMAKELGFSGPETFSRWLRQHAGESVDHQFS